LVALIASFLSSLLSIDVLLKVARKLRFWRLCIALGVLGILSLIPYLV
jgi:undecaprenyl pyrophosphate phosphatase UppP